MLVLVPIDIRKPIDDEYTFLCTHLGLTQVPLDVFYADPGAQPNSLTPLGSDIRSEDARYGRTAVVPKMLALPLATGDDNPISAHPPTSWHKLDSQWPTWRIELWHEVVHQHSDQVGNAWNPLEPPFVRPDGRGTRIGHGAAWWNALTAVAGVFSVDPVTFSALIDL
jgi:hypothetical protein